MLPQQPEHHHSCTDCRRKIGCQRHTNYAQLTNHHKKQVEKHVDDTGKNQCAERTLTVPFRTENGCAEIVDHQERHTGKIDSQIVVSRSQDIRRRMNQHQQRFGDQLSQCAEQYTVQHRKQHSGMYHIRNFLLLSRSDKVGNAHIGTDRKSCRKSDDQRHDLPVGSHGCQCVRTAKPTGNRRICCIKQLLENAAQRNGERK